MKNTISKYYWVYLGIFCCLVPNNNLWAKTEIIRSPRHASLIIDRNNGLVLHQENANKHLHPASLTKMMTVYLTFEALKSGKLLLNQELIISEFAASRPRVNMNLVKDERIKVKDALFSTIIKSANDTSVVLAEAISGSEDEFAKLMTKRAHQLGMHHTLFKNASGLHHPAQKTTAHDMARLAIALNRDFPEYYKYFAQTEFNFKNNKHYGHNRVTKDYPGATGLKTGFINASGFNLVTSAERGDTKLIGVVLGGETAQSRDKKMISLLDQYFIKLNKTNIQTELANTSSVINLNKSKINKSNLRNSKKVTYKLISNKLKNPKKKNIS